MHACMVRSGAKPVVMLRQSKAERPRQIVPRLLQACGRGYTRMPSQKNLPCPASCLAFIFGSRTAPAEGEGSVQPESTNP